MIVGGIDIGSRGSKAVVMDNNHIVSSVICDTGPESVKTSVSTMEKVLAGTGLTLKDVKYVVATGYGRVLVPFANENISEISCHARGVNRYFPSVKTVLDMGGQDCKAISIDSEGKVVNFVMNDKCAGGTGRFLEMIADVLNTPLTEIGDLALKSKAAIPFNTICAVFARSEAITCLKKGVAKSDILSGLNEAIATRCLNLLKRVSIQPDFSISGGIAKNKGMVAKIKERVGIEPKLAPDPQLIGAIGAAIFARERCQGRGGREEMKVQYGYSDGTGDYFITVDTGRCDGCGECIKACPASLFTLVKDNYRQLKAGIKEESRKKLHIVCPGFKACAAEHTVNCHSVCPKDALSHAW